MIGSTGEAYPAPGLMPSHARACAREGLDIRVTRPDLDQTPAPGVRGSPCGVAPIPTRIRTPLIVDLEYR